MDPLAKVLVALAVLAGSSILFEIAGYCMTCANAESTVAQATKPADVSRSDSHAYATEAKSLADQLKEKNLFVRKPPKEHPVKEIAGILGGEVLINDKWYKAGDTVGDAKVVAVKPTSVTILWEGEEKEFAPMGAADSDGPAGRRPPMRSTARRSGPPRGAPTVVTGPGSEPRRGRSGRGPSLSDEERTQLRERWNRMTPEERQKLREEMRARFGRRNR